MPSHSSLNISTVFLVVNFWHNFFLLFMVWTVLMKFNKMLPFLDIKNEQHSMTKTEQRCAGTVTNMLSEDSSLEVAVKVEKEEGYGEPIPVSLSVVEEPNSDRLSLAQSQLLEDWRPEPLQSESCQTNMYCQSTNQSLGQYCLSNMPC